MRILPPTQSEAEQRVVSAIDSNNVGAIVTLGVLTAGLAYRGDQAGGLRMLRSSNKRVALITKCIAYGTVAVVSFALHNRYLEQRISAHSLRPENIAVPRTVFIDRLSHFDGDNAIILGGLTGIFIASRFKKTRSVTGWHRHTTAMAIGAAQPTLAFWMCEKIKHSEDELAWIPSSSELTVRPVMSNLELALPSEFIQSARGYALSELVPLSPEGSQSKPDHNGSSLAMLGLGGGSGDDSSGSDGGWGPSSSAMGSSVQLKILTDKPHIAVKQGDKEAEFQPQTNYGWYSNNKIAELEEHIAVMRERRKHLAQEAEVVWAWLAEKEADYLENYPVTKKREDNDEKPSDPAMESSMFVQSLGQVHANIWREASACDWMIADSQKRIAQEKSLAAAGRVEWRSNCSQAAAASPLKTTLETLKDNVTVQAAAKNQVEQALSSLAMGLADPNADLNAMAMHPIKNEMATQKEIIKDIREHLEEQKRTAEMFGKTLEKAIAEAERKAGRG